MAGESAFGQLASRVLCRPEPGGPRDRLQAIHSLRRYRQRLDSRHSPESRRSRIRRCSLAHRMDQPGHNGNLHRPCDSRRVFHCACDPESAPDPASSGDRALLDQFPHSGFRLEGASSPRRLDQGPPGHLRGCGPGYPTSLLDCGGSACHGLHLSSFCHSSCLCGGREIRLQVDRSGQGLGCDRAAGLLPGVPARNSAGSRDRPARRVHSSPGLLRRARSGGRAGGRVDRQQDRPADFRGP